MSLLAPLGLLALLALPVIVTLHMLRERRRRVVVPSLLLWHLLAPKQEAQRRQRLPLTLLLLLHLLAAMMIGLALARPQWNLALFGEAHHIAVIVDTSTSMAAPAADGGTRLEAARARVRWLISGMDAQETVTLIATAPQPHRVATAGPEGAARLLAALDGLRAGGTGTDLAGALTLAEADLQGQSGARIVVVTDGSLPAVQIQALTARAATLPVDWTEVGSPVDNRAIVSLATRQRGTIGPVQVYARAVNAGQAPLETVLRLFGDDQLLDTRAVRLAANGEAELTWTVPRGITLLRAELDGGDGLPADDTASLSLAQTRPLNALIVATQPVTLERVLRAMPGLTVASVAPNLYASAVEAGSADLTIFDGFLPAAWPGGGVLVINPPLGSPLLTVHEPPAAPTPDRQELQPTPSNQALQIGATGAALFDGVSLDSVAFGPTRTVEPPAWAVALLSRDKQPLMLRGRVERSEVAIWSFDLTQGNLMPRLAFPLLMARTVRDLTPTPLPVAALLGDEPQIIPNPRATRVEVAAPDGTVQVLTVVPGERLPLSLDQPGVYTLAERADARTLSTGQLAVNAGASVESDLTPRDLPDARRPPSPTDTVSAARQPLWPWLAAVALAVMVGEWAYVHGRRRAPAEV